MFVRAGRSRNTVDFRFANLETTVGQRHAVLQHTTTLEILVEHPDFETRLVTRRTADRSGEVRRAAIGNVQVEGVRRHDEILEEIAVAVAWEESHATDIHTGKISEIKAVVILIVGFEIAVDPLIRDRQTLFFTSLPVLPQWGSVLYRGRLRARLPQERLRDQRGNRNPARGLLVAKRHHRLLRHHQ